jgi:hypothetical protein
VSISPLLRVNHQRGLCPSTEMVKEVQKWIFRRNELNLASPWTERSMKLTKFLMLVSDLL